ncbi:MAG: helix-turn-helix domain containing protein [Candidatus Pacebacteria bacterium]|nr:helix-turn-helix domain containing protein [Candidatus Paceibacterota bacterium]
MARKKDRETALELRKKGMSYSQIKNTLNLSKSTLSNWLRDYPLSKERIRELRDCNEQRIERYRETMRRKKEARLSIFYNEEKAKILPINKSELYLAGLFLYWGEGSKNQNTKQLLISNTDPAVIKFFIYWLEKSFSVLRNKMCVQLHLYSDMDINREIDFWSKTLGIGKSQFIRPYIKESLSTRINHKGAFGHGTCNLRAGSARDAERVLMGLKAIRDCYIKKK